MYYAIFNILGMVVKEAASSFVTKFVFLVNRFIVLVL
jgi:hypothetical protein